MCDSFSSFSHNFKAIKDWLFPLVLNLYERHHNFTFNIKQDCTLCWLFSYFFSLLENSLWNFEIQFFFVEFFKEKNYTDLFYSQMACMLSNPKIWCRYITRLYISCFREQWRRSHCTDTKTRQSHIILHLMNKVQHLHFIVQFFCICIYSNIRSVATIHVNGLAYAPHNIIQFKRMT